MRMIRMDDYPHGNPGYDIKESRHAVRRALTIFESNRIPYIFGVTPLHINSEDVDFLNSLVRVGEVVMHGFSHRLEHKPWSTITDTWPKGGEFYGMQEWEIEMAYDLCHRRLKRVDRYNPEHFIPPFNTYTQSALNVLSKKGVKYLHTCSKEWDAYDYAGFDHFGITPVVAPYQKTYDYAHKVMDHLRHYPQDESQIVLHWIFDKDHEGWESAYQDLCDFIREEAMV
jgi:predicted deacetylase